MKKEENDYESINENEETLEKWRKRPESVKRKSCLALAAK
jgi:hypothetical protein